jgi:hypothetical protein
MVTANPKRPGRPRRFPEGTRVANVLIPPDLRQATVQFQRKRLIADFNEAIRELMREAAEANGLIKPRKRGVTLKAD